MYFIRTCRTLLSVAVLVTLTACEEGVGVGDTAALPAAIEVVEGGAATQQVATDVAVAVTVLNAAGEPLSDIPVQFAPAENAGTVSEATVRTDAEGIARTTWTLGAQAGTQEVTASVEGVDAVTIAATATAGDVAAVDMAPDSLRFNALRDTAAVAVTVTDEFGNEYADAGVTFTSLDTSVVTVTSAGQVVSKDNGTALVTATVGGVSDTVEVTVRQELASFTLEPEADTAAVEVVVEISGTPYDPNGIEIVDESILETLPEPVWTVSDASIATIGDWDVTGHGLGTVTITATVNGSLSDSFDIFFTPSPFTALASGGSTNCALDVNGQAWCWGEGGAGQLGNGALENSATPVQVSGGHTFVELAATGLSFCGVADTGTVYCWGFNGYGGVGIGVVDDESYATPQAVAGGASYASIDGDWYTFCAVRTGGAIDCWGLNRGGAAGVDPAASETCAWGDCLTAPNTVSGQHEFVDAAVGFYHSCAVDAAGDVWCWGTNNMGQFGNGATSNTFVTTPVAGPTGYGFETLDANWSHTCGIESSGQAYCWGANGGGRLGDGTTTSQPSPVLVTGGHAWAEISAANGYTCGTTTAEEAYCWGFNILGKLGTGDFMSHETPTRVAGGHSLVAIEAGFNTVCALDAGGDPYCWGAEARGALGTGVYPIEAAPVAVHGGHAFTKIAARAGHSCAVDSSGEAWCWGEGFSGQLGTGTNLPEHVPAAVSGGHTFAEITNAHYYTCGLTTADAAYCWGSNRAGQLGDGTNNDSNTPVAVSGGHTFQAVSAGRTHACAIDGAGAGYCWGDNDRGKLGDGTTTNSNTPVAVTGGHAFVEIGAGQHHSCGLTAGDEIYCWGSDGAGALGSSATDASSSTPVLVDGGQTWSSLSVGNSNHVCAINTANEAYCWGLGTSGQLGHGTTGSALTPALVSGGHAWASISAMGDHTCGVTTGGTTYCWGANGEGELGNGNAPSDPVATPTAVSGSLPFTRLSGSYGHTCGITSASEAYCWGFEGWGQLGNNQIAYSNAPQEVQASFRAPSTLAAAILNASTDDFVAALFRGSRATAPVATGDGSGAPLNPPYTEVERHDPKRH